MCMIIGKLFLDRIYFFEKKEIHFGAKNSGYAAGWTKMPLVRKGFDRKSELGL